MTGGEVAERSEALEVRERALALVNLARASVGAGELADFPPGVPLSQDTHHPLVAALAPCGVRFHLLVHLECLSGVEADVLRAAWGRGPAPSQESWVDFAPGLEVLTRFIDLFDGGAYPDLVAVEPAEQPEQTEGVA